MTEAYHSLSDIPEGFGPCVVTIGNFDGVHLGHRQILTRCVQLARETGSRSVAVLFDPHPLRVIAPERAPKLMTTPDQRIERFAELGVDAALVLPFTEALRSMSPEEFVRQVLAAALRAEHVVVGRNFRFGKSHAGDIQTLEALGLRHGFRVEAAPEQTCGGRVISSSAIRAALVAGRPGPARRLLGEPYSVRGTVVPGRGVGSTLTVPTLNLKPDAEQLPQDGVYATRTRTEDGSRCWRSVTNVGVRPTFGPGLRVVETHLLDSLEEIAPDRIEVCFLRRLRGERRFESPEALRRQILTDAAGAKRMFRLLSRLKQEPAAVD